MRKSGSRSPRKLVPGRLAAAFVLVALFFAGAAFSAAAGDVVEGAGETESSSEPTSEETATETQPEEPQTDGQPAPSEEPAGGSPDPEPQPEPEPESPAPPGGGTSPSPTPAPSPGGGSGGGGAQTPETDAPKAGAAKAKPARARAQRPPEVEEAGAATVWLHRVLPDPTPPAARLAPAFARLLRQEASRAGVHWSLVLGVLRAQGRDGRVPAGRAEVRRLAVRLARLGAAGDAWEAVFRFAGDADLADRAVALACYDRAVRLRGLVEGLAASKGRLSARVLRDDRVDLYPDGRADVMLGRVDVRVVVLLRYLAIAHGQVTVSSLRTGHRLYARPGVVSAHAYGLAADISAVGGRTIAGNQEPGGLTERAVRNILLLPDEVQPQQVITLLGLGGPSFPLADHDDHIHVGY